MVKKRKTRKPARRKDPFAQALNLHRSGQIDSAEPLYRRALSAQPRNPEVLHLYGVLKHQRGEQGKARDLIERAIRLDGRQAAYHSNLGLVYIATGEFAGAVKSLRRAVALKPDYPEGHSNLGLALEKLGAFGESAEHYRRATELRPAYPEALNNLGVAYKRQGRLVEALDRLEAATQLAPQMAEAWTNLGAVRLQRGELDAGVQALQRGLELAPSAKTHHNVGAALLEAERVEDAVRHFELAVKMAPGDIGGRLGLGQVLAAQGRRQDAAEQFRAVIAVEPSHASAHYHLALLGQRADTVAMDSLLSHASTPDPDRLLLHFAQGRLLDSDGEHERAFEHFERGNALRRDADAQAGVRYDPEQREADVARVLEIYDAQFFAERADCAHNTEVPIFVVGVPRSGTSLLEQVLSSHPQVHGGGELYLLQQVAQQIIDAFAGLETYPESARRIEPDMAGRLAIHYLSRMDSLPGRAAGTTRVTDKMPANDLHLGLVGLLFPKARVIYCSRDPLDSGLSCYGINFERPHPYANRLEWLGHYHRMHARLVAHWQAVLPNPQMTIHYEQLVEDPEQAIRALLRFCNLDWDERCLHPEDNPRPVLTASTQQVRQRFYASSVGRWRNFARQLEPLRAALEPESTATARAAEIQASLGDLG